MGILLGLERIGRLANLCNFLPDFHLFSFNNLGWKDVPLLAMETEGCECFNLSLKAGRIVDVEPTSIAKTLGCRTPAPKLMEKAKEFNIISQVLPDKCAAQGCVLLAGG